jgi:UDP-N-acetylglucosamine diphosphorylase/glucosamine-1-phosphate N-acetyltransferase
VSIRYLYIFEDDDYERFYPLTVNRAVYQLRLGIDLLYEKWKGLASQHELRLLIRGHLAGLTVQRTGIECNSFSGVSDDGAIFVNGRYLADRELIDKLSSMDRSYLLLDDGALVAAMVEPRTNEAANLEKLKYWGYGHFKEIIKNLPKNEISARKVRHIWDFIELNPEQITKDFERLTSEITGGLVSPDAVVDDRCLIHAPERVRITEAARIDGQVVIDARGGPVYLDSGVIVEPHTRIEGPCYIGEKTMLVGGKIREGCSIGPLCKVGGEVEESIILGYSNKFHDGFLGHAYLGEWVNLGALTTNSDLKNNYGTIKVDLGYGQVDTGIVKIGSFIGDHVKTGIGTMLNTGITIGFATNIFGAGLTADKYVPPFCWGNTGSYVEYQLEKAVATARVVMERRGVKFTELDEQVFGNIFKESSRSRAKVIKYEE